jgi:hypothetical protein
VSRSFETNERLGNFIQQNPAGDARPLRRRQQSMTRKSGHCRFLAQTQGMRLRGDHD